MPIPDFQTLMLPVMRATADGGEHAGSALIERMAIEFNLTQEERATLLPSGRQAVITNRVHWAITYLAKCGLLDRTRRGYVRIAKRGREVLAERPQRIDLRYLARFPELERFRSAGRGRMETATPPPSHVTEVEADETPDERLRQAHREIDAALKAELLMRVLSEAPAFFEQVVVDVLVAMGFGGTHGHSARLGGSGDGGVDGVIDQDALGLDRVYVQAKRFTDRSVGSGDIRNFFGSLDAMKAAKGVFITTSSFSRDARDQAERLTKRIVLIDGEQLGDLMLKYGVGVRIEQTFDIKRLDEDYFLSSQEA